MKDTTLEPGILNPALKVKTQGNYTELNLSATPHKPPDTTRRINLLHEVYILVIPSGTSVVSKVT